MLTRCVCIICGRLGAIDVILVCDVSWLVLGMSDSVLGNTDGTGAAETEIVQ